VPQAAPLIEGLPAKAVMADTAYGAAHSREVIAEKGAAAVIPNNPPRTRRHPLDKHLHAQRHLVECCFSKLKQFRRVATHFEKTARSYLASGTPRNRSVTPASAHDTYSDFGADGIIRRPGNHGNKRIIQSLSVQSETERL